MKVGGSFQVFPEKMGKFAWVLLLNLLIPFLYLLPLPFGEAWPGYLLFFVTACAWQQSTWREEQSGLAYLAWVQIIAIACLGYRYSPSYLYLGFYAAMAIGRLSSIRMITISTTLMMVLFSGTLYVNYAQQAAMGTLQFVPLLIILTMLPYSMRANRKSKELKKQLESANEEISRLIKNEERQRIARDLHDTLGHTLSLITLKSELVERLVTKHPERAIAEARDIQQTARTALHQVRELISDMQTIRFADEVDHAGKLLDAAGITYTVKEEGGLGELPSLIQTVLGMCLRECVTNVVKHSRATRCDVRLELAEGAYRLVVSDNGKGIMSGTMMGNGLPGMRDRLALLDGKLAFADAQGKGSVITITIPRIKKERMAEGQS
ncbi:sensor histidine kinase [Brevibacillus fluminis]|uniref:sensor histidine kinase n=1 Tax=Brevibacillus fluminis TaxID=511487 RepID=UPI003F8BDA17